MDQATAPSDWVADRAHAAVRGPAMAAPFDGAAVASPPAPSG